MKEWLQILRIALKQGYLLTDEYEARLLSELIHSIEDLYTATDSYYSITLTNLQLVSVRKILAEAKPSDTVTTFIYDSLKKAFNEAVSLHEKQNKLTVNGIESFKEVAASSKDEKQSNDIDNLIAHRFSLIASYHRLNANFNLEASSDDEKQQEAYEQLFQEFENIINGFSDGLIAHYGFSLLKQSNIQLRSQISLKHGLFLTCRAISNLPSNEIFEAKAALVQQLIKIHRINTAQINDDKSITTRLNVPQTLNLLFQIVNEKNPDIMILNSANELPQLIKKRCQALLKQQIAAQSQSEQTVILDHLDQKDELNPPKFWWDFTENTQQILEKEFSVFKLILNKDIENEIKVSIQEYIKEESTRLWLKDNIKHNHYASLKESAADTYYKKQSLLHCLNAELKCTDNADRVTILVWLQERVQKASSKNKEEINSLCKRFGKLIAIDKYQTELKELQLQRKKSGWKFVFSHLNGQIMSIESKINESYKELKLINRETNYIALTQQITSLRNNANALKNNLIEKLHLDETIFTPDYKHRPSYQKIVEQNCKSKLQSVAAIFDDYSSKGILYFHWRHHEKEAKIIASTIRSLNNIESAKEYLTNYKNSLLANNQLNNIGSFSRRLHFCLTLLNEKKPDQKAELSPIRAMKTSP